MVKAGLAKFARQALKEGPEKKQAKIEAWSKKPNQARNIVRVEKVAQWMRLTMGLTFKNSDECKKEQMDVSEMNPFRVDDNEVQGEADSACVLR